MLFIESRVSANAVEETLRLPLLERLQERGFVPLIRSVRLHCYETALLDAERAGEMERSLAARAATDDEDSQYVRGDIFCFEDFVLFLIFDDEENAPEATRAGIVYEAEMTNARSELEDFCRNVSEALISARGFAADNTLAAIEWQERAADELPRVDGFAAVRATDAAAAGYQREVPIEAPRAAELLDDTGARRLLRRIKDAHADGSVADLLSGLKGKAEMEALIGRLAETGLLRREVVISCRQVERPLFRLPSPDALSVIMASNAICSECGANIADEKVEELVVPTDTAARLLEDGSWLSNRLRSVLLELGVSEKQISATPTHADSEAYMIANVCRELFLFVLKDGDVTGAHARHALGKQNETEAAHLVIVATGKIQEEARTRLREHARRRSRSSHDIEVLLIESTEAARSELQHAFERASNRALADELSVLNASLGLNVSYMLSTRFRLMHRAASLKDFAASTLGALT